MIYLNYFKFSSLIFLILWGLYIVLKIIFDEQKQNPKFVTIYHGKTTFNVSLIVNVILYVVVVYLYSLI